MMSRSIKIYFLLIAAGLLWVFPVVWGNGNLQFLFLMGGQGGCGNDEGGFASFFPGQQLHAAENQDEQSPAGIIVNQAALNGLFSDTGNPGHGFDFNLHEFGFTVYYYGHTFGGQRLWLISEPYKLEIEYGKPFELEMFEVVNGTFGAPKLPETSWGTLTLELTDCDSGWAGLDGKDGTQQFAFSRLVGLAGFSCESWEIAEAEPNGDSGFAQVFRFGETVVGNLSDIDDIDWYAVDMDFGQEVLAYVTFSVSQVSSGGWTVDWYGPGMQILSSENISAPEGKGYEFPVTEGGRYYLRLRKGLGLPYNGATYRVTLTSKPSPGDTPEPTPQTGAWTTPANGNEHGDEPPQWVTDWSLATFGHGVIYGGDEGTPNEWINKPRAFKGQLVNSFDYTTGEYKDDGSEGYFRYHGQANAAGRCTRYHSFELYWRDSAGNVTFLQGQGDFGDPATDRFPRADGDPGGRPAMLVNDTRSANLFEQWYGRSPYVDYGIAIGLGTTHYESNECDTLPDLGVPTGDYGLTRLVDGVLYESRLPKTGWYCSSPRWYQEGEVTSAYNTATGECGNPDHIPQYVAPTLVDDMYFYYLNRVDFRSQRSFNCAGPCSLPN